MLVTQLCVEHARRGTLKSYEGETCRNAHLRGKEHLRDLSKQSEKSALFKHILQDHKDEKDKVQFQMKITGRFKSAMNRQIDEGIRIQNMKQDCLLNSKNEFFGPAIKRKILEGKTKKIPENHQF